jgi:hypothetical protein
MYGISQVDVGKRAFQSEDAVEEEDEDREASPKAVGHNIFILAKQVSGKHYFYNSQTFHSSLHVGSLTEFMY